MRVGCLVGDVGVGHNAESMRLRTIVKPLWSTSTLGSKHPSHISQTKNVALKLPKISFTEGYLVQFKATFLQSWVIFVFFCVLGVVGHRGFTIVLT